MVQGDKSSITLSMSHATRAASSSIVTTAPTMGGKPRFPNDRIEAEVRIRVVKKLPLNCPTLRPSAIWQIADRPREEAQRQQWPNLRHPIQVHRPAASGRVLTNLYRNG